MHVGCNQCCSNVVCVAPDDMNEDPLRGFLVEMPAVTVTSFVLEQVFGVNETPVVILRMLVNEQWFGVNETTCGAVECCCDVCDAASRVSCSCWGCCCCGCCGGSCKRGGVMVCCVIDTLFKIEGGCEKG